MELVTHLLIGMAALIVAIRTAPENHKTPIFPALYFIGIFYVTYLAIVVVMRVSDFVWTVAR